MAKAVAIASGAIASALLGMGAAHMTHKLVLAPPAHIEPPEPVVARPEPIPPPPLVVEPATPPAPAPRLLKPIAALYAQRGIELLQRHDFPAARSFLELAFNAGDNVSAVSLWQSYDIAFLTYPSDRGQANASKAREWLERAEALDDPQVRFALQVAKGAIAKTN